MDTTENEITFNKWTSEAGPRQTKKVEQALHTLRYAGRGIKVLSTWANGTEHENIVVSYFDPTPEEGSHKLKRIEEYNKLHSKYGGLITRDNFRTVIADCMPIIDALEAAQPVRDERRTPEQLAKDAEEHERAVQRRDEESRKEAQDLQDAVDKITKEYPYLKRLDSHSGVVEAAKNIRIILKREFPGIKFSVRSDYSSVNVGWIDGPTAEVVEGKIGMFKSGHFNGMEDIYEYSTSAFNTAFGSVKYLFTSREYREGLEANVRGLIGAERGDGSDTSLATYNALRHTDLTGKGEFTGLVFDYEEQRYTLQFRETPKAPVKTATTSGQTYTIEEHTHTKKQKQYFLCIAADRMEREEFNAERDRAKACGGWYSRAWQDTPGGFAFWTKEEAEVFGGTTNPNEPGSFERIQLSKQVKKELAAQRPDLGEGDLVLETAKIVEGTDLQGVGGFSGMRFEEGTGWLLYFRRSYLSSRRKGVISQTDHTLSKEGSQTKPATPRPDRSD